MTTYSPSTPHNLRIQALPYVLPFSLFALITILGPQLNLSQYFLYPLKTLFVGTLIIYYLPQWKSEIRFTLDWAALLAGVFVFLIWIGLEGTVPQIGDTEGFNPNQVDPNWISPLIGIRLIGAVLVVPVMEELFWRSFALRFLIESRFTSIPLGTFNWFSFIAISIAFGFEHHRWLPGILAGLIYALLLYRSKNLFSPILSHAVTNFLLGIYVLTTEQWSFW
jgi:CAAX prenyl protease-like protein